MSEENAQSSKKKGKGPAEKGGSKPATYASAKAPRPPKISSNGTRVTVSHSEVYGYIQGTAADPKRSFIVAINAFMVPWLAAISAHFQVIRFKKVNMRYVPRIGTQAAGTVYIAPFYLGGDSGTKATGSDVLGANDWIKNLSGVVAQSVSGVVDEFKYAAKFILKNAARQMFKTAIVAFAGSNAGAPNPAADVLSPGSFAVLYETVETAFLGELYIDYTVELSDPAVTSENSFEVCRITTTPATLSLQTAYDVGAVSGNTGLFKLYGNEITFNSRGVYQLTIVYMGSTPVPGALIIYDKYRATVTDVRSAGRWDVSALGVINMTTPIMNNSGDASSYTSVGRLWAEAGDIMAFPTLTSGTLTTICIYIARVNPDLLISP